MLVVRLSACFHICMVGASDLCLISRRCPIGTEWRGLVFLIALLLVDARHCGRIFLIRGHARYFVQHLFGLFNIQLRSPAYVRANITVQRAPMPICCYAFSRQGRCRASPGPGDPLWRNIKDALHHRLHRG